MPRTNGEYTPVANAVSPAVGNTVISSSAFNALIADMTDAANTTPPAQSVRTITAAGPVTVTAEDEIVAINKTVGAATTVNLPTAVGQFLAVTIKDLKGDAGTNNITIDADGSETIDGSATLVLNTNYQTVTLHPIATGGWFVEGASVAAGAGALLSANNLSDVANAATSRTNLGLGTGNSPQFTAIEVGAASDTTLSRSAAGVIAVEGVPVYSNLPQNSQSAAYTTVLADAQKHILHPTADNNARTFTIDSNANVAYPIGTIITFVNQINTVTIAITSDTLVLAGPGSTGSRTLAANGIASALKIASTTWIISGTGLT